MVAGVTIRAAKMACLAASERASLSRISDRKLVLLRTLSSFKTATRAPLSKNKGKVESIEGLSKRDFFPAMGSLEWNGPHLWRVGPGLGRAGWTVTPSFHTKKREK